ncbi:hypothetical protein jhhlp_000808 [Lomentospora prolificans]|uniref:Zn(2)-C6 fungal-type domain-containing protein n=1 Tax=Lomentospora prolificans TaxID=41688 RepID=A0A2N3NJI1_9PEZI|nr:hypothetical protein jhhlp_000808 [Lomentospora prolificans]
MDSSKWRVSKACQECRAKKIRCNGEEPCQRCKMRGLTCVYRAKARNRQRKVALPPDSSIASSDDAQSATVAGGVGLRRPDEGLEGHGSPSIHIHSVAATHRASPGCVLELYYGPSSNFSMLHSIYHQIEGTTIAPGSQKDVEEVGPGLDKLGNRRIFFGDWADSRDSLLIPNDYSAMFLDRALSQRLMETYLSTYWHILPVLPQTEYRRQLDQMHRSPAIFSYDSADNIILILAMALGASILDEGHIAEFLFQKAKQGAEKLDEVVNVQAIQVALMMISITLRKAIAAGLHKDVDSRGGQTQADMLRRRKTLWSLYFFETWICFSMGRPRSMPEPCNVPVPPQERLLKSLVTLSRIMSKCAAKIYEHHHQSLLPLWHAANEIRRELHEFAEQQRKDMNFGLVGDPNTGELGVCQTMVSTMYHHTLLLAFRPFLVLRAKLKKQTERVDGSGPSQPAPPPWLDMAAEYCLDAARHSIGFLAGAFEQNNLCLGIKYHGFFLEGNCYVLIFDMLRDRASSDRNLPWIIMGLKCIDSMFYKNKPASVRPPPLMATLERMLCSVIPDFRLEAALAETPEAHRTQVIQQASAELLGPNQPIDARPTRLYPSMPFGFDMNGPLVTKSPAGSSLDEQIDLTAADMGWNFDLGTMDMDAFFSIDANQQFNFST